MFIVITVIESHIADTSRCLRRAVREHGFDEEDARLSLNLVERDHEQVGQLYPLAAQCIHLICPPLRPLVTESRVTGDNTRDVILRSSFFIEI